MLVSLPLTMAVLALLGCVIALSAVARMLSSERARPTTPAYSHRVAQARGQLHVQAAARGARPTD